MISVLYNIILITNFKLIEMCIKSSLLWRGGGGFYLYKLIPLFYLYLIHIFPYQC